MQTPEFHSTVYAFLDLVQKRAKRPAGAPDKELARPVTKVGVVGAGLMASQLALLVVQRLQVPVVLTDGTPVGTCTSIVENPAHDLVELGDGRLVPLPFVVDVGDAIEIDPPEGLLDLG